MNRRVGMAFGLGMVLLGMHFSYSLAEANSQTQHTTTKPIPSDETALRKAPAQFKWTTRPEKRDMDVRADAKRDEAINKLKKILPTIPDGPQKAELLFRLAEMYWSTYKFRQLAAMRKWDRALQTWYEQGRKGPQPKLDDVTDIKEAESFRSKTLDLYRTILGKYPRYERKDEVLYNLASSHYESGEKLDGVKLYWKLLKQYPNSEYGADAWLQLGEHFFNANQLPQAIKAYSKAAETERPRVYSYALYKLAWCDYNLQEYQKALEKFGQVIAYAKGQKAGMAADGEMEATDRVQLMEEALADMVRTYSHLDAVDNAVAFYWDQVGKEVAYKYLRKLAEMYNAEGKYELEIAMYERLNHEYPYHPRAPSNHTATVNAYAQLGDSGAVRREVRRLIDLYSPNGLWARRNAGDQEVLSQAFEDVEQQLATLVTEKHREAQATKLVETYQLARDIYAEYLSKFENSVNSYKFRFFYAEILFELKAFADAGKQYTLVVQENKKGRFAQPAAYNAILAWEKVVSGVQEKLGKKIQEKGGFKAKGRLAKLEQLEQLKKGKIYEPENLSEPEQKLANACDAFVALAPNDEEVVKIKFKSARLYYVHNQFEEAATRFGDIVERWPRDSLGRLAAESIVQSWNVRENWTELNRWARKFKNNKVLMADKTFAKKIHEFVEGASFNEIHFVLEPREKPLVVANAYAGFVREFPKSKYAMVGLFNAVVNYDKANVLEKAIESAEKLLKEYRDITVSPKDVEQGEKEGTSIPKPKVIRDKTLFLNAQFHERLAMFKTAAALYEQYANEFPKGVHRADSLFNAGLLQEGLGHHKQAIDNFMLYARDFPNNPDVPDIRWRIGVVLERQKDYRAAAKQFSALAVNGFASYSAKWLCAKYKTAQAYEKQGRKKDAQKAYASIVKDFAALPKDEQNKPCPFEAVAAALFFQIEPEYTEYISLGLKGSEREMAKRLMRKLQMVDVLQKRYTSVLAIGQGDFGIAALYRIGAIYQHLAQEIFSTPCPRRLNDDQCMIYQAELQAKAFPLEEKAIEAFDKALAKAYELGLYNTWLGKAQKALTTYEPMRFPEIRQYDLIAADNVFSLPKLSEVQP